MTFIDSKGQFNNIVEPFTNSLDNHILNKKNEKQLKITGDKNKLGYFFMTLATCLGIVISITYFGANLVFYKWALQGLTRCSSKDYKKLFDVIFPTEWNKKLCSDNDSDIKSGGNKGTIKECIAENSTVNEFCAMSNYKMPLNTNFSNPGIKEWFIMSSALTNVNINEVIKTIISFLPYGNLCWITFIFAIILIPLIIFLVTPLVSFLGMLFHEFREAINLFNCSPILSVVLIFLLVIGFCLPIASIYSMVATVLVAVKLLLFPLLYGGKDTLFKIIGNHLFLINILVIIMSLITVISISNLVNKNIYTGILIAYIPLILSYLYKIFT
tara:strand:- start:692 stop:1675 length:984 start_codon:yes stop_codon:yes gene_type:complete